LSRVTRPSPDRTALTGIRRKRTYGGIVLSLRDELLNGEIFYTLREAQIVMES